MYLEAFLDMLFHEFLSRQISIPTGVSEIEEFGSPLQIVKLMSTFQDPRKPTVENISLKYPELFLPE